MKRTKYTNAESVRNERVRRCFDDMIQLYIIFMNEAAVNRRWLSAKNDETKCLKQILRCAAAALKPRRRVIFFASPNDYLFLYVYVDGIG